MTTTEKPYGRRATDRVRVSRGTHSIMEDVAEIVLVDSVRPIKLFTIPMMLLAALGLFLQRNEVGGSDVLFLYTIAPWWVWCGLFSYTLFMRCMGLFYWPWAHYVVPSTSVIGIFVWSAIFTSGAVVGHFDGMDLLYVLPALLETLILARQIGTKEHGH